MGRAREIVVKVNYEPDDMACVKALETLLTKQKTVGDPKSDGRGNVEEQRNGNVTTGIIPPQRA